MAQLIKVRCQHLAQTMHRSALDATMDRIMLEAFIFHASTSVPLHRQGKRPVDIDLALSLAEKALEDVCYRNLLDYLCSPILGVPPKLFACVREITLMHQRLPQDIDVLRCHELLNILCELEIGMFWDACSSTRGDPSQLGLTDKEATIGPRLYVLVSKILLQSMLSISSGDPATTILQLVEESVDLVNQLRPMTDYYAEYYGWPMRVLEVYATLPEHRSCLLSKVAAFWRATRNGTMGRLMKTLTYSMGP